MKYIGIRGHRGSGKNTVSYLLGSALDYYYRNNKSFDGFQEVWRELVDEVKSCPDTNSSYLLRQVPSSIIIESFATTPRVLISLIFKIEMDILEDDYYKDNMWVDLSTFQFVKKSPLDSIIPYFVENGRLYDVLNDKSYPCVTAEELIKNPSRINEEHLYMSLGELIIYFGRNTMQTNFGKDVWVKSLIVNQSYQDKFYDRKTFKIFTDVKFPTEVSYIKNNDGIIIDVIRKKQAKKDTSISQELKQDNRIDHTIDMDGYLWDKREVFEQAVIYIDNHFKNKQL